MSTHRAHRFHLAHNVCVYSAFSNRDKKGKITYSARDAFTDYRKMNNFSIKILSFNLELHENL